MKQKYKKIVAMALLVASVPLSVMAWEVGDPIIDGWSTYDLSPNYDETMHGVRDYGSSVFISESMYYKGLSWLYPLIASDFRVYYHYKPLSIYGFNIEPYLTLKTQRLSGDVGLSKPDLMLKKLNTTGYDKGWVDVPFDLMTAYNNTGTLVTVDLGMEYAKNNTTTFGPMKKINEDRSIYRARMYYKSDYQVLSIGHAYREEGGSYWEETSRTATLTDTHMYDYYVAMRVSAYQALGSVKVISDDGVTLLEKSGTGRYGMRDFLSLDHINTTRNQTVTIRTRATKDSTDDDISVSTVLLRKKKPGPKVSSVTRLTGDKIGDNTKVRYRINTTTTYTVNATIKAKLGNITKTGTIISGSGYVDLEWDSSEIGECDIKDVIITVDNGGGDVKTTNHSTSMNIKYILKETTNNVIGQMSPKSNIQRTVFIGASDRVLDDNVKNRNIIDSLASKLKAMQADVYVVGPDNAVWKRLSAKFE